MSIRPACPFRTAAGLVVALWSLGTVPATARQAHTVSVGIHGIVVLAVDTGAEPLEPGVGRAGVFALTSNRDATNLVARLDEALPPGLSLELQAETDLASGGKSERLVGAQDVVLLEGLSRGVRRGQALHLRVEGRADGDVHRTLNVGLVDPVSGQASWQAIPLTIRGD